MILICVAVCAADPPAPSTTPPGVVIDHIAASTGIYIGSPSIAVLPGGDYVASHDHFGPKTKEHENALTAVFRSADRGKSWKKISEIRGQFWSTLFVHRGALYIMGTDKHHGNAIIRRSTDGGQTWTTPRDAKTGLLRDNGQFHCGPMPVIEHAGRLWRAIEHREPPRGWGITYCAGMLSVPVDADLLDASNWIVSNFLPSKRQWLGGTFGGWLEGNAVVAPDGHMVDVLRVESGYPEKAAIVNVSADGRTTSFDPQTGFVDFPGGAKKFAIRHDAKSNLYWSLATIVPERHQAAGRPGGVRNTLALTCSPDLVHWTVRCIVAYHPDTGKHGFQYVDWIFEGDDILAACRTAYDDGQGGAHNAHDANFLTFHRIANFRVKTMADSVPFTELPQVRTQTRDCIVTGYGWTLADLADGQQAFGNRGYVWQGVPKQFSGWQLTQTCGGQPPEIRVAARIDTMLLVATAIGRASVDLSGWEEVPEARFHYNDSGKTTMVVLRRALKAGQQVTIPQGNWTGTLVLLPGEGAKP